MKAIKSYIQYNVDGFTAERKFTQLERGEISFLQSFETKLLPFAMDRKREEFIIFRIDRGKEAGLYLWVYLAGNIHGKKIRLTMINELMNHSRWTDEPMDVSGNYSETVITKAIQLLQAWTDEEIWIEMKEMDKWMNEGGKYPEWKEDEAIILRNVRSAKKEGRRLISMY